MLTGPLHDIRYSPVETLRFVVFIHAAHTGLVSSKALGASVAASLTLPGTFCEQLMFVVGLVLRDWAGVVCVNDVRLAARFISFSGTIGLGAQSSFFVLLLKIPQWPVFFWM